MTDPDQRGRFITLEGPDGAGKSVQAARLAETLRARGLSVVLTREPGGTPFGEQVRALLLAATDERRAPLTDALLFNAARSELVRRLIRPALDAGSVVVCDRFSDSTLAYQGFGGGAPLDTLRSLAAAASDGLVPDRTILLDLAPETGLARRASGAAEERTRFEDERFHDLPFHRRVRDGFRTLAAREPDRWRVVDAAASEDGVAEAVLQAMLGVLPASAITSEPSTRSVRIPS